MVYPWREKYFYSFKHTRSYDYLAASSAGSLTTLVMMHYCMPEAGVDFGWLILVCKGKCKLSCLASSRKMLNSERGYQGFSLGFEYLPRQLREVSGLEIPRDADLGPEQFHDKLLNTIRLYSNPALCFLQVVFPL